MGILIRAHDWTVNWIEISHVQFRRLSANLLSLPFRVKYLNGQYTIHVPGNGCKENSKT